MNSDSTENAWHYRTADLSAFAGKTISTAWINEDTQSGAGNWEEWFSDISFYRTDGTVVPIYHRQTNVSYSGWGSSGVTNQKFEININYPSTGDSESAWTTTYYIGDQTGSVREEFGGEGWPVSSSVYYPFGVEQATTNDPNSYKFATLERDSESNLDHATFREYTPLAGRWMSPDPYNGSYDLNNPQSFNRYVYAMNNPLRNIDPSGLDCATANEDGSVTINSGDCPGIDPNNEYYYDCDGCLMNTTGGYINPSTGDLVLTSQNGNMYILGNLDYTAPQGPSSSDSFVGPTDSGGGGVSGTPSNSDPPCKIGPCTYTIFNRPHYPPGNACTGKQANGQPAQFVSLWDCVGTVSNCKQNQQFYQDSCSAQGNVPMQCVEEYNVQAGAGSYTCQCCNYGKPR